MFKKSISVVTCCTLLFAACKKDKEEPQPQPTKAELLQAGKWQITASTQKGHIGNNPIDVDQFAEMEACEKDDYLIFGANGTAYYYTGDLQCSWDDSSIVAFSYKLINNDSQIAGDWSDTTEIKELSATTLVLSYSYHSDSFGAGPGVDYIELTTYKNIK